MSGRVVRVASWPHWYAPNPYLPAFYEALEPRGIEHVPDVPLHPGALRRARIDVLHVHWPYPAWREAGWLRRPLAVGRFLRVLSAVRAAGVRLAWTVHNHRPHERAGPLDRIGYRGLHGRVDLEIHHSEWSVREAARLWGPARSARLVVPHGTYEGYLPSPGPPEAVRRSLGIPPSARLLVCAGQVRAYKGFDVAAEAVRRREDAGWHLVVAGRPISGVAALRARASGCPRVTLRLESLEDGSFADLVAAADAVLLPYRSVTSSGALAAALTLGTGVVAAGLPYFREVLAPEPRAAEIAGPGGPDALARAVARFLGGEPALRHAAVGRLAERYAWARNVGAVAEWMRG